MKTILHRSAVLLILTLGACTSFQVRTLPSPAEDPVSVGAARITPRHSARIVVLRDVRITADSLVGWADPDPSGLPSVMRERMALSREQVLLYEPRVRDRRETAGVVVLTIVAAYAVAALYAASLSY